MEKPRVCVLRTAGTNCDKETAFAFELAGAESALIHINKLFSKQENLSDYQILVIPGGFSYGDNAGAGKIMANELKYKLKEQLDVFLKAQRLIIGICNGFQVLVKSGLLPGNEKQEQEASLIINDSGKFEDRWVYLKTGDRGQGTGNRCIWTKNLPEVIYLPVAHGEGKFITRDDEVLRRLEKNGQVVLRYNDEHGKPCGYPGNPNGSLGGIAGICDETGRILGLMPHPERHLSALSHPAWKGRGQDRPGDGLEIFRNGVEFIKNHL